MVNIYTFPGGGNGVPQRNEDVSMLFSDQSSMVFSTEPTPYSPPRQKTITFVDRGDWTNQELADLYRVEAILVQSGIRLETERGVTDEGDPWFVFCNHEGEVLVHLARLDGSYLLDSPGIGKPIHGNDFPGLVDTFVRSQTARAPRSNIILFRPGSDMDEVICLHPAMMMAAVIWSLFLVCDEFAGTAEAAQITHHEQGQTNHQFDDFGYETSAFVSPKAENLEHNAGRHDLSGKQPSIETRSATQIGAPIGNNIAASLSAIAASWGLYNPPTEPQLELPRLPMAASHQPETDMTHTLLANVSDSALSHVAAQERDGPSEGMHGKTSDQPSHVLLHDHVKATNTDEMAATGPRPEKTIAASDLAVNSDMAEAHQAKLWNSVMAPAGSTPTPSRTADTPVQSDDLQSLLNVADSHYVGEINNYAMGSIRLTASFDIGSLGKTAADLVFAQLPVSERPIIDAGQGTLTPPQGLPEHGGSTGSFDEHPYIPDHISAYTQLAKDFVLNFLQQSPHVEMIRINNAIIFVDTTAIDDATDVTAFRSWALDDMTITTVGHADYFAKSAYLDYGIA